VSGAKARGVGAHSLLLILLELLLDRDEVLVLLAQRHVLVFDMVGVPNRPLDGALLDADEDDTSAEKHHSCKSESKGVVWVSGSGRLYDLLFYP